MPGFFLCAIGPGFVLSGMRNSCKSGGPTGSNMTAMAKMSEEQILVERFRRGDDAAFDEIVEQHGAEIAALANRLLGWPQDVDDVIQEVFLAAFRGLATFRGECRLRSWLFTITINKCRHHRRRLSRLRLIRIDEAGSHLYVNRDATMAAIDAESLGRVRRAVRTLPDKYREAVVLRYLQGLDTSEVCRLLGITANALNVRLSRARERLKHDLDNLIEVTP
jgi:RNA polymerase sigma factor (sigma-70 family)